MNPYEFLDYLATVLNNKVAYEPVTVDGKTTCQPVENEDGDRVEPLVFRLRRRAPTKNNTCQAVKVIATTDLTQNFQGDTTIIYLRVGGIKTSNANVQCGREILTVVLDIAVPVPGEAGAVRLYERYHELAQAIRRWNVTGLPSTPPKGFTLGASFLQSTNSAALNNETGMGMQCFFDVQYSYPRVI